MCYIPTQCLCCFCRFSWVLKVIYVTDPICNSAWDIGQSRQVRVSRKYIYTDTVFMRVIERISFNTLVESIRVCKLIWHCASVSARDDDTFRRIKELKLICVYILLSLSNCNTFYTGWSKKTGPPAILSHCKYSENSMTELQENWWTSAILYAEHSH